MCIWLHALNLCIWLLALSSSASASPASVWLIQTIISGISLSRFFGTSHVMHLCTRMPRATTPSHGPTCTILRPPLFLYSFPVSLCNTLKFSDPDTSLPGPGCLLALIRGAIRDRSQRCNSGASASIQSRGTRLGLLFCLVNASIAIFLIKIFEVCQ